MDVQKTMEFILEQQAASTVMINRLVEAQYNTEQNVNRLAASLNSLTESKAESDARLDRLDEVVKKTSLVVEHMGEKVDALVAVVDSLVRRPQG